MNLRTATATDVNQKIVLVRTDYNVPLQKKGASYVVSEPQRILDSIPLLQFLIKNQAKIILMSHLGRPKGEINLKFSLKPVAQYLKNSQDLPVKFVETSIGPEVTKAVAELNPGEILLLENLRFYVEEKKNEPKFAQQLASLADVYINEAFSTCHRADASIEAITHYLPSFAGPHLQSEVRNLSRIMVNPKHPFVMIIGGAKISTKIEAVQNLYPIADIVLVGGGVANNFLKAEGIETHKSVLEEELDTKTKKLTYLDLASQIVKENKTEKILKDGYIPLPKILTPIDVVAARTIDSTATEIIDLSTGMADTPHDKNLQYFDIGPKTIKLFTDLIMQAKTIFWTGPIGVFEKKPFTTGTKAIAKAMAQSDAETFIGGGDTIAAANQFGYGAKFDYASSAGGASLEFLSGKKLPGLQVLQA